MTPDLEAVVGDWLREDPAITAVLGSRVTGRTPSDTSRPWARVALLDDRQIPGTTTLHVVNGFVQIDCYAGTTGNGQEVAADLARLVRARLHAMPGVHEDAVVSGVTDLALRREPDDDFAPSRERYLVTGTVYAHST